MGLLMRKDKLIFVLTYVSLAIALASLLSIITGLLLPQHILYSRLFLNLTLSIFIIILILIFLHKVFRNKLY